jgi:hypothetical protein
MVMGAFFSEVGNKLLGDLVCCFESCESVRHKLAICATWTHADFDSARQFAQGIGGEVNCQKTDLSELRRFLIEKRPFLLGLLQNPTLLEHDRLTDLLWAVFHLTEELEARPSVKDLPASDREHLAGDIRRLYHHLAPEWISYAEHLRSKYPFLFSLVCRTHPLQDHPSAEVS